MALLCGPLRGFLLGALGFQPLSSLFPSFPSSAPYTVDMHDTTHDKGVLGTLGRRAEHFASSLIWTDSQWSLSIGCGELLKKHFL